MNSENKKKTLSLLDSTINFYNLNRKMLDSIYNDLTLINIEPKYKNKEINMKAIRVVYTIDKDTPEIILYFDQSNNITYSDRDVKESLEKVRTIVNETSKSIMNIMNNKYEIKSGRTSSFAWN